MHNFDRKRWAPMQGRGQGTAVSAGHQCRGHMRKGNPQHRLVERQASDKRLLFSHQLGLRLRGVWFRAMVWRRDGAPPLRFICFLRVTTECIELGLDAAHVPLSVSYLTQYLLFLPLLGGWEGYLSIFKTNLNHLLIVPLAGKEGLGCAQGPIIPAHYN